MRLSNTFFPTLKEVPADAKIESTKLMLRAAFIRKLGSGLYSYLPLGYKSIRKIMQIIREEMDAAGAQEFMFPILLPKELLTPAGRWSTFKKELFRLKDRHEVEHALGATHEEAFTQLVKNEIQSYKQLPMNLYQMHTKFRDEIRPRFGVIRSREFIMKDAYSFHTTDECLDKTYNAMSSAYTKIFKRMGLETVSVKADSGAMGGEGSEEFMVLSEVGEEEIVFCKSCGYKANSEKAVCAEDALLASSDSSSPVVVDTPNVRSIEELKNFFDMPAQAFIKTLIYEKSDGTHFALSIRGDLDVNDTKLANFISPHEARLADEEDVKRLTNAPTGFAGPIGLQIPLYADESIRNMKDAICGGNDVDKHIKGVNPGKDFSPDEYADFRLVKEGDKCPECGAGLYSKRGLELGHIFKLGRKYTQAFGAVVLDENNKEVAPIMGCYGIGVNRTLASVIEQNHDENGIIMPISVAPFEALVVSLDKNGEAYDKALEIYEGLKAAGVDAAIDDRDARPGVKFKDADLIGVPIRIIIGKRGLKNGSVEFKLRNEDDNKDVPIEEVIEETLRAKEGLFKKLNG